MTVEAAAYSIVHKPRQNAVARATSRLGFLASSAAFAIMSKPTYLQAVQHSSAQQPQHSAHGIKELLTSVACRSSCHCACVQG
jgi:hypothetical protein